MYNCSREFKRFYQTKVVLPEIEKNELRKKRKLNIKRLKDGLMEYNEEKNKSYKIVEDRIQGSMAMHTITQNDKSDYDIDVAIVFESDNLGNLGAQATRNMVADALERKTKQFENAPIIKTSCIRLHYVDPAYHVDFAVFSRLKENYFDEYTYKHAGSEWTKRHIKALEEWFNDEIKNKGNELRKVLRLSKMFCKSRDSWKNMPSGLIQTILCNDKLDTNSDRLDQIFYQTMKAIVRRLDLYLEVSAPVDHGRALVTRDIDYQRMSNWKKRLGDQLDKLDILFEEDCTYEQAINAWSRFFNHNYWDDIKEMKQIDNVSESFLRGYDDTEQFIEDLYPIYEQYNVTIECKINGNGFLPMTISEYFSKFSHGKNSFVPRNFSISCKVAYSNCPSYDKILWKVLNVGEEAVRLNDIRGQIEDRGPKIIEHSNFSGEHYIECYLIKDDVCVAVGHIDVPIGGN